MKNAIIGSAVILLGVNLFPYACRIWRGLDWVAQYLPDEGHLISGLLFMGGFASLPAIPLIVAFLLRNRLPITFMVSIVSVVALLSFWHHNYDLASDAQAAIGLIFIPIYVTMITAVIGGVSALVEVLIRRRRLGPHNPECA